MALNTVRNANQNDYGDRHDWSPAVLIVLNHSLDRIPTFIAESLLAVRGQGVRIIIPMDWRYLRSETAEIRRLADAGAVFLPVDFGSDLAALVRGMKRLIGAGFRQPFRVARSLVRARRVLAGTRKGLFKHLPLITLLRYSALWPVHIDMVHYQWIERAESHLWLKPVFGCPAVASLRGADVAMKPRQESTGSSRREALQRTMEKIEGIHAVTVHILNAFTALGLGAPVQRVIRTTVPDKAREIGVESSGRRRFRVLLVASLTWYKGHVDALQAVHILMEQQRDLELMLVGAGPEHNALTWRAHCLGLSGRGMFVGHAASEDVYRYMKESDVLLHPALVEGFPNSVAEAMRWGLPVVCAESGGIAEVMEDHVHGLVVPVCNPYALAGAIAELMDDRSMRVRLSGNARKRAADVFGAELHGNSFSDLYRSVYRLGQRRATG